MGDDEVPLQHWFDTLLFREQVQIRHATDYAENHADAGVPGHGQFILIAKLTKLLEEREQAIVFAKGKPVIQKIIYIEKDHCWRDVYTGIKVEI